MVVAVRKKKKYPQDSIPDMLNVGCSCTNNYPLISHGKLNIFSVALKNLLLLRLGWLSAPAVWQAPKAAICVSICLMLIHCT